MCLTMKIKINNQECIKKIISSQEEKLKPKVWMRIKNSIYGSVIVFSSSFASINKH